MFTFRKAITSEAKPLVGLYSESGCGKTKSSLLLAAGFVGGDMAQVGMIETESGRGEAYANEPVIGGYNVLPIREEFSPTTYGKAITAAEKANLQCLIVDSASHEWEGLGGVLGMAAENQASGKKGPLVWQKPKMDHAREFMLRLTQTPIPLVIVCMRAKYPMMEVIKDGKKEWARSPNLSPKQSEDILFEMFVHGWIDQEHRFHGTKYTLEQLRKIFLDDQPITVETGQRLAHWAAGGAKVNGAKASEIAATLPSAGQADAGSPIPLDLGDAPPKVYLTVDQVIAITDRCKDHAISADALCAAAKVRGVGFIEQANYDRAIQWIDKQIDSRSRKKA